MRLKKWIAQILTNLWFNLLFSSSFNCKVYKKILIWLTGYYTLYSTNIFKKFCYDWSPTCTILHLSVLKQLSKYLFNKDMQNAPWSLVIVLVLQTPLLRFYLHTHPSLSVRKTCAWENSKRKVMYYYVTPSTHNKSFVIRWQKKACMCS